MNADVKACARCGSDHDAMPFEPLSNPTDEWTHWGMCPTTKQPVLLTLGVRFKLACEVIPGWTEADEANMRRLLESWT